MRFWSKGTKLQLCRMNKARDVMDSMVTMVTNTVLCNLGNLPSVDFRCSHHIVNRNYVRIWYVH